ncbi:signal peptidase I [Candidatus Pacearchaeota archaeon]|nr:signal peptidase I [Candidatus Pacearchaeota archaeon]
MKQHQKKEKSNFKKVWEFLWDSNSIWSWIVDFILIFLLVKFIVFPLFSLMLTSALPFVIIESGSMEHQGTFDSWFSLHGQWYLENDISKETVYSWKWNNGLDKGDIMIIQGNHQKEYEIGDVIVFNVPGQNTPTIHRIINMTDKDYTTKGDHNDGQLAYEHQIIPNQVIGKAIFRIPKLGWFKLFLYDMFK